MMNTVDCTNLYYFTGQQAKWSKHFFLKAKTPKGHSSFPVDLLPLSVSRICMTEFGNRRLFKRFSSIV